MIYVTETEIAEELRNALVSHGEINPGTPLYDLTAQIGVVIARLHLEVNNDLNDKMDRSDIDLTEVRTDIELLKKNKEDIFTDETDRIATKVADILWDRLKKEREEDRGTFLDELKKL